MSNIDGKGTELWERKCVDNTSNFIGCRDEEMGPDIKIHVCLCNTDLCNEKIDDIPETTTPTISTTTTHKGIDSFTLLPYLN